MPNNAKIDAKVEPENWWMAAVMEEIIEEMSERHVVQGFEY